MNEQNNASPGLYSRYFTPSEHRAVAALPFDDLSPEIKLIRVLLIRLLATEKTAGKALALEDRLAGLRAISHATSILGKLIRAQLVSQNPADEFNRIILQALEELNLEQEEMN